MVYILVAVLIFGLIILIHEFGHFTVAKACGIKVNEFAIGMGPKLLSFGKGETKFSLRAIPMGGYVSMEGEDEESPDPRAFNRKKVWQRLLVVLAGAAMNLILGFVILIIVTSFSDAIITTQIAKFESDDAVSHQTGLEPGDEIIKVNGMNVYCDTDISYQFQTDEDLTFEMTVIRNGEKVILPAVQFSSTQLEDGTNALHIDFFVVGEKVNPLSVIEYSSKKFVSVARMIWLSLRDLITGKYGLNDLSGPVGIVGAIGDVVGSTQQGVPFADMIANLASFVVFITINVGIFNLLPIPALDGSRAIFLIIEGIRRKPLKPQVEGMIHMIGMILLLGLMIVVTISDIFKLF
ncbi:MAG: site-2 protease family protein [Oscillospiraceae bacterium]|nr:site-2 protease family protein [Oscillospiraceae bacterium]